MSSDISFGSGSKLPDMSTLTGTTSTTATQTTQVIDNQWEQDSLSTLYVAGPQGVFKNLPNNPALPKPDTNLINQAPTISKLMNGLSASINQKRQDAPPAGKYPNETILNQAYDQAFEQTIKDMPNKEELRFAHYNSPPGAPRTAEEQLAFEKILTEFGLTSQEFTPTPIKSDFVEEASITYDEQFSDALENHKPPLSEETKAELKFLHFNPGKTFKGSDSLKGQLKALEQEASAKTAEKFGIPTGADGKLPINFQVHTSMYQAQQNGFYQEYVNKNASEFFATNPLNADGKPWTKSEQQMLQQFIDDPSTAVPEFIAAAGTQIRNAAIAEVVSQFHLEAIGFQPVPPGTFPAINPESFSAMKEGEEILAQGYAVVNAIPPNGPNGPLKTILIDILRHISRALGQFKLALYEGQGVTSEQAQANSKAKLDMALNQIKENVAKAKEAAAKQAKIDSMGIFGKIFKFIIMLVLLIISACSFNPAGMQVAVMGMIDAVKPEVEVFKKVMNGIANMVKTLMPYLPPSRLTAMQDVAKFAFILYTGAMAIMIALPDLLTASSIIKHIEMGKGKSAEEAEAAEQTAIMAITLSVTLVAVIVSLVFTFGASFPALMPGVLGRAAVGLAESMEKLMESGGKAAQIAMATATTMNDLCSATGSGLQIGSSLIKRDLALMMAKAKAAKEMTDADVENLLKLIKKLIAALSMDAAFVNFVSGIQSHILSGVSESTTNLTAA